MHVRTKAEKLMPRSRLLFRRVAQGVGDAQGHGDLVAVHQEAPDFGLVGIALDELLVAVRHLRPITRNAI